MGTQVTQRLVVEQGLMGLCDRKPDPFPVGKATGMGLETWRNCEGAVTLGVMGEMRL